MNLLLFRKIILVSRLTETELLVRLTEIIDLKKGAFIFIHPDPTKSYIGKIDGKRFKIHRIIKGQNSFVPIIQGNIIDNFATRKIELKMRLHIVNILFLLWAVGLVAYYLIKLNDYNGLLVIGVLFSMTIFFFNHECNKSIKDLEKVLGT